MHTYKIGDKECSSGAECRFVKLDNGLGLKLYYERERAEHTYNLQKHAALYGLAPQVGPFIFKFISLGKLYWGYYTECITHNVYDKFHSVYGERWLGGKWPYESYTNNLIFEDMGLPNLYDALLDIGIKGEDLHYANCGWLANGNFVCIDFSECQAVIPLPGG